MKTITTHTLDNEKLKEMLLDDDIKDMEELRSAIEFMYNCSFSLDMYGEDILTTTDKTIDSVIDAIKDKSDELSGLCTAGTFKQNVIKLKNLSKPTKRDLF